MGGMQGSSSCCRICPTGMLGSCLPWLLGGPVVAFCISHQESPWAGAHVKTEVERSENGVVSQEESHSPHPH